MRAERKGAETIARGRKRHRESGMRLNGDLQIRAMQKGEALTQRKDTLDHASGAALKEHGVSSAARSS